MNKFKQHSIKMFGIDTEKTFDIDLSKISNLNEFEESYSLFKIGTTKRYYLKVGIENFPEFDLFDGLEYFLIIDFNSIFDEIGLSNNKKYSGGFLVIENESLIFKKEENYKLVNGFIYFNEEKLELSDISKELKPYEVELNLTMDEMKVLSPQFGIFPKEELLFKFFQLKYLVPFELIHVFLQTKLKNREI